MDIKTVSDRIIEDADKELLATIKAELQPFIHRTYAGTTAQRAIEINGAKVQCWVLFDPLIKMAFENNKEEYRNTKIAQFMAKLEKLSAQFEDLQQQIESR